MTNMFIIKSPEEFRNIFEGVDNPIIEDPKIKEDRDKIAADALLKIRKAKIEIHKSISFFSKILLSLEIIEDWGIKTMCTNGTQIKFNPKFTMSLSDAECTFVIMHEILHVVFLHFARIQGRDPERWNYAADYAINLLLDDREISNRITLKMPIGGLLDKKYLNMSAEQIYDSRPLNPNKGKTMRDLLKELGLNPPDSGDNGDSGDSGDSDDNSDNDDSNDDNSDNNDDSTEVSIDDYIETNDGKYGKITKTNSDGTYEYDEVSKDEFDSIEE